MIANLSDLPDEYQYRKRQTLDRLSDKYSILANKIFERSLARLEPKMFRALEEGRKLKFKADDIEEQLIELLTEHRADVARVGVSDAIREVKPNKDLAEDVLGLNFASWRDFPVDIPIENTFTSLASKKVRDSIWSRIYKKMSKGEKKIVTKSAESQKKRYLNRIANVFADLAKDYFEDEDSDDRKKDIVEALQTILGGTRSRAEAVFRTETTRHFTNSRLIYFRDCTEVDFVQIKTKMDNRVSKICEARHNYVIPIGKSQDKQFKPPFHVNCRCITKPLDTDISRQAEEVRANLGLEFGKVHSETSNKDFKGRRPKPTVALPHGWV